MDDTRDQLLQEWLDRAPDSPPPATTSDEQADLLAYQTLFSQLETPPTVGLPYGFARRVRQQLEQRAHRRSDVRFYLFCVGLFVVSVLGGYSLLVLVDAELARQTKLVVIQHSGALLAGIVLFLGIQLTNSQWVQQQVNAWGR
ncbi:hypothetical protein [Spirosoma sp.]|uniref:hypothetical protein n=1 Tax=Spirosoma sp. TaxID=1899569 RepID=UPI0026256530|nr:hypothetical protein [Spirosoma sp.]MCX6215287.1 hypothetical protein [Spirosoma sp.]